LRVPHERPPSLWVPRTIRSLVDVIARGKVSLLGESAHKHRVHNTAECTHRAVDTLTAWQQ